MLPHSTVQLGLVQRIKPLLSVNTFISYVSDDVVLEVGDNIGREVVIWKKKRTVQSADILLFYLGSQDFIGSMSVHTLRDCRSSAAPPGNG